MTNLATLATEQMNMFVLELLPEWSRVRALEEDIRTNHKWSIKIDLDSNPGKVPLGKELVVSSSLTRCPTTMKSKAELVQSTGERSASLIHTVTRDNDGGDGWKLGV